MSFKFRKRVRLFPGFTLNLSKSGMSATVGMRGLSLNVGEKGKYLNVGIPGTGIYDRIRLDDRANDGHPTIPPDSRAFDIGPGEQGATEIKSFTPELITSQGLFGLKETIVNAERDKRELYTQSMEARSAAESAKIKMILSKIMIFGFFVKSFDEKLKTCKAEAEEAKRLYNNFKVSIDFNFDSAIKNDYVTLRKCFESLASSCTIWDVKTEMDVDRVRTRSAATKEVTSEKVSFEIGTIDFINTKYDALKLRNDNGCDLFIYPGFIAIKEDKGSDFGLLDFRDLEIEHYEESIVWDDALPPDAKIIDRTWRYVNKNGQQDRRFKNNYEIPIVLCYQIRLSSKTRLRESYIFSNPKLGEKFCKALQRYRDILAKLSWSAENAKQIPFIKNHDNDSAVNNEHKEEQLHEKEDAYISQSDDALVLKYAIDNYLDLANNVGNEDPEFGSEAFRRRVLKVRDKYGENFFNEMLKISTHISLLKNDMLFIKAKELNVSMEPTEEVAREMDADMDEFNRLKPRYLAALAIAMGASKNEIINEYRQSGSKLIITGKYINQFKRLIKSEKYL